MESIREQQRRLIESIRSDTEAMERQRREIVKQMCQVRTKVSLASGGTDAMYYRLC